MTDYTIVPLSDTDRKIINARGKLLWVMFGWLYAAIGICLLFAIAKTLFINGSLPLRDLKIMLFMGGFVGGLLGLTHAGLTWYERRGRINMRSDLATGIKHRYTGVLESLNEGGAEPGPVTFVLQDANSGNSYTFELHTLSDLSRIQPRALLGKHVEVDQAPNTRIVLALRPAGSGAD